MASTSAQGERKKQRKSITLETKLDVLKCLSGGQSVAAVSRTFRLSESTVRTIKKNEASIQESVLGGTSYHSKHSSYVRDPAMGKMEKALLIYIEEKSQKRCPLDQETIMAKALKLYGMLKETEPASHAPTKKVEFTASKGWFYNFIRKNAIKNVQIKGESASADVSAAQAYKPEFLKLIEDGGYHPDQIFNADETGLFWKKMPSRTYVAKSEKTVSGFKTAKDRVTLLFCSNASGDKILKPLLLHKAMRPRSMKDLNFEELPVHWMSNPKAWVTKEIWSRWVHECFAPEVEAYMEEKGLSFRVLLLIDNAPGHLVVEHPNIKTIFLPPNTTSIIQPLDQGIIATFKRYYIKTTFRYILDQLDTKQAASIIEAWKSFTMRECVKFVGEAVALLKTSTLNACWKPLWPDCVRSSAPAGNEDGEILLLAHAIGGEGFNDFSKEDIEEMITEPFYGDEDILDFVNDSKAVEDDDEEEFTEAKIKEGLELGEKLADYFITHDTSIERAVSFRNDLRYCLFRYSELVKCGKSEKVKPDTIAVQDDAVAIQDDEMEDDELGEKISHRPGHPKRKRCRVIYDSD